MTLTPDGIHTLAMMRTDGYVEPSWPERGQLQQMHLDISDPAGHPFCLTTVGA
ncbi:hypothetical protein TUM20983_24000 [Mycobacterium antarcticum]|uniref:hypothetical protein n=1 Tax=Mycolicibacterium sp. TUM20983 TaxID=3023369 RepID=UPI00239E2161|nr:hypothetical protein [Mycolicibacterium sp. TUM20983]GLP75290.1 hypothetical protein TUM20983_24000 [Mycolicibacterium sp. TUM20983]